MATEVPSILKTILKQPDERPRRNLYDSIHDRFAAVGGVDLHLPPREPGREPPWFD